MSVGGDGAAVDGEVVAGVDRVAEVAAIGVGGEDAGAVRLAVDGEVSVGADGFIIGGGVRDGEGCAVAEDQVGGGVGEAELPADGDVGGDDVPVLRAVRAIRDVAVRARDDGVVGAYLRVAVRVDVGDEVRAERLARDVGAIDRALVDGGPVGEQLPALDGDGAGVRIVAADGDAVGGVRPAESDVVVGPDAVGASGCSNVAAVDGEVSAGFDAVDTCCIDGAAVDGEVVVGSEGPGASCGDGAAVDGEVVVGVEGPGASCGDVAAVDGEVVVGVDAVGDAFGGEDAGAVRLAVDGDAVVGEYGGGAVFVRDGEGCAVAEDQVGTGVVELEPPANRDVVGDDVPSCLAACAVRDVAGGVCEGGVGVALLLVAVRINVGDGGHGRCQRLARDVGGDGRAAVGAVAVDKDAVDGDAAAVAAGVDAVAGVRPAEGDVVGVDADEVAGDIDVATIDGEVVGGDSAVVADDGDGAAVDGDVTAVDAAVAAGGAHVAAVDGEVVPGAGAVGVACCGDGAAIDGEVGSGEDAV